MLEKFFRDDKFSVTPSIDPFVNFGDGRIIMSATGFTTACGENIPAYFDYCHPTLPVRVYSDFTGFWANIKHQGRFYVEDDPSVIGMMASDYKDDGHGPYAALVSNECGLRAVARDFDHIRELIDNDKLLFA